MSRGASKQPRHPGASKAQRAALDAIGTGNFTPAMTAKTKAALLEAGLIQKCGERRIGRGPLAVTVEEYEMPIPVHMEWCTFHSRAKGGDPTPWLTLVMHDHIRRGI